MSYRIEQEFKYNGNDYWRWWAWIEAEPPALDRVSEVVWLLHPTFKKSEVRSTDRANKFRLDTGGWGTFVLRARLQFSDGSDEQTVSKRLRLEYPTNLEATPRAAIPTSAKSSLPSVFLSYSMADARFAREIRQSLEASGAQVFDPISVTAGESFGVELDKQLKSADIVIGVSGSDELGSLVVDELRRAREDQKLGALVTMPGTNFSARFEGVPQVEWQGSNSIGALIDALKYR